MIWMHGGGSVPSWRGVVAACVVFLAGCRLETRRTVDSADDARAAATSARDCGPPLIDSAGVGGLRVGATLRSVTMSCSVLRDTTEIRAEGMPARVLSVSIGGDTVEAEIVDGRVWRIAVGRPGLRTADSLGVGTTLAKLTAQFPGATAGHGEDGLYVTSTRCGLSFRLANPEGGARSSATSVAQLRRLPPNTAVDRVLVTDCITSTQD